MVDQLRVRDVDEMVFIDQKADRHLAVVRVKRCGKSAPAFRVTGVARQTPPEARPRMSQRVATAQAPEGCSPEPAGRPLEAPGNGVSRWMVAASSPSVIPRRRGTESGFRGGHSRINLSSNAILP
jgi:hypothetical protein